MSTRPVSAGSSTLRSSPTPIIADIRDEPPQLTKGSVMPVTRHQPAMLHRDIFKCLEKEHPGKPGSDESALKILCVFRDLQRLEKKAKRSPDDQHTAEKACFFHERCEI